MAKRNASKKQPIAERIEGLTGQPLRGRPVVISDTTNFMSIDRDQVIDLDGHLFLIRCNEREGRFGLDDQPKFWVKRALSLENGRTHVLKLVIHEEFTVRIGTFNIKCSRNAEKEGRVLKLVEGDSRFMQGHTVRDSRDNLVRVIDFIQGVDLLDHLGAIDMPHDRYFRSKFPEVLAHTIECLGGIRRLHEAGLCHGDVRNDHILVERETGRYRWIDFDLTQDYSDYDVWSVGNILHFVVGKGFITFREVISENPCLSGRLLGRDASVIFPHRVMNLRKVYPYLPEKLNDILVRFSAGTRMYYDSVGQVLDDLQDCAVAQGWPTGVPPEDSCEPEARHSS
jgi:hypothetical protein